MLSRTKQGTSLPGDEASKAHREQEQRDTLRQRKSGVMLRQSNAHEQEQ